MDARDVPDVNAMTKTMLFDFFGDLLTEKQREFFDLHYNEDLSLAEIAELFGVTRQGVWDSIRRAESAMAMTEQKTGLISRFLYMRKMLDRLEKNAAELRERCHGSAGELCDEIITEISELKGI